MQWINTCSEFLGASAQGAWMWQFMGALIGAFGVALGVTSFHNAGDEKAPSGLQRAAYWGSLSTSWVWYAMPLLPQPRFPALPQLLDAPEYALAWFVALAGLLCAGWGGHKAMRTVAANLAATGPAMRRFRAPAHLLVSGPYATRRHPMFVYDFACHAGLALLMGATMTMLLLPLYWLQSATFNLIEERWVLQPRFGAEFDRYRRRVPFAITPAIAWLLLAITVLFLVACFLRPL